MLLFCAACFRLVLESVCGVRVGASLAMAAAHLEGVRERLGPSHSALQVRFGVGSVCVWVALPQEQLVEYVDRLKALAATSGEHRAFDVWAVEELMLKTPRIVQQAILEESRHCGHSYVKYPGSLRVPCSGCFDQESLGAALEESASHESMPLC